jgi:transposase
MAGKIVDMSKIKQVLRLHDEGKSNREIARVLNINKETVNNYVKTLKEHPSDMEKLLTLDDPELERKFHEGNPAYTDKRFNEFSSLLPYLQKELERKHVTRRLLWEEYIKKYPGGYRFTQFCFHLKQNLVASSPTTVLWGTYNPAEKLYVDFAGDKLSYVDIQTGEIIKVEVFVACLPYTDYGFALCVPSQKSEDFIYAIRKCLEAIGGVPKILVTDNLKSAVVKSDRYEPEINKILEDMGNHYGFVTIPCQPRAPKQKALVENHVKLVYHNVYAKLRNQMFYSLEELNADVSEKMHEHNQTRMQQRPYSREEHFFATEKELLSKLRNEPFEVKLYSDLQVQSNCCVYLGRDKRYYSVPYKFIGKRARVIYTRSLVSIYVDGKKVAVHLRTEGFGYTIVREHMASNSQAVTSRSAQYYIDKAARISQDFCILLKAMFDRPGILPETQYKRCDGLFHLLHSSPLDDFNYAYRTALANGCFRFSFIEGLVKNAKVVRQTCKVIDNPVSKDHANIRGKDSFK